MNAASWVRRGFGNSIFAAAALTPVSIALAAQPGRRHHPAGFAGAFLAHPVHAASAVGDAEVPKY